MFQVSPNGDRVKTDNGTYTIKYSKEYRRYQVRKAGTKDILAESFNGFQGALDIIDQLSTVKKEVKNG